MDLPELLLITNPRNSDPEEDIFLSNELKDTFNITVTDPTQALTLLPRFSRCLIRNAWPSRLFVNEFSEMKRICSEHNIKCYNPFPRNGYVEDKIYLIELYQDGYPVIPTADSIDTIDALPPSVSYIIKPKDSCSSDGIEALSKIAIQKRDLEGLVIQPEIDLVHEISFYFIDDVFEYATISAGKNKRWELTEYQPSAEEITWATQFVRWNAMPYGLQRIDGCRTIEGRLLLMEIDSRMPILTLFDLSESTRHHVLDSFTHSLLRNL